MLNGMEFECEEVENECVCKGIPPPPPKIRSSLKSEG